MFLVFELLILELTFHHIQCSSAGVPAYASQYNGEDRYLQLFDRAEFPPAGVLPMLNRKVFGSRRVSIREHPYVASIRRNVAHYSVGCILTRNVVLTVAHPLINVPIAELSIVVGENYADRGSMLLSVILIVIHENFNRWTLKSDIAMLKTFEDIIFKGSTKSIPLMRKEDPFYDRKAFVTGWGRCDRTGKELCLPRSSRYTPNEKLDPMLRTSTFIIKNNITQCRLYERNEGFLPLGMLCLGEAREQNPVAQCLGAPGAPLVVGARLAALLSWGFGCCHYRDLPLIYTDINQYQGWIMHNIQVFHKISRAYLFRLFQAKRAYVLKEWLNLTRVVIPEVHVETGRHMAHLRIDKDLSLLAGDVLDIRDFIHGGIHSKYKKKLYFKLREALLLEAQHNIKKQEIWNWFKKQNQSIHPFLMGEEEESSHSVSDFDSNLHEDESTEDYVV